MKEAYFNINTKAQTMVELAVFGSLLLVVLAYFVGIGMRYNYQQDLNMRAQRMAFERAYYPVDGGGNPIQTTHGSSTIILTEDHHIPDPRTMFGRGDYGTISAAGDAVWGSYIGKPDVIAMDMGGSNPAFDNNRDVPKIAYNVNGVTAGLNYSTAGIQSLIGFWVILPDGSYVYKWNTDLKIHRPNPDAQAAAKLYLNDTDTFLVAEVAWYQYGRPMPVISVSPANGADGDNVSSIQILNPTQGDINPDMMNTEYIKNEVQEGHLPNIATPLQGLLPVSTVRNNSNNQLTLTETAGGSWVSSTTVNSTVGIDHKIKNNSTTVTVPYNRNLNRTWTWTTSK